jgi:hypothetical protein
MEHALRIGASSYEDFRNWIDAGGFDNKTNDTWCGYKVLSIAPIHSGEKSGVLTGFRLVISNSESLYTTSSGQLKTSKIASANNLRNDLAKECTRDILNENVYTTETEKYFCSIKKHDDDKTQILISLKEKNN